MNKPEDHSRISGITERIDTTLKSEFPDTTFSVGFSEFWGGPSIVIRWADGPTLDLVGAITDPFVKTQTWLDLALKRSMSPEFRKELAALVLAESGEQEDLSLFVFQRFFVTSR